MADRWVIQYGTEKDNLRTIGRASTRIEAAGVAQAHFDTTPGAVGRDRIIFDVSNPAGDYCCAGGWYRITRLSTGQWKKVE